MAGKFSFTLKEYQEAAVKYRSDFLMLPIIGIGDTLQYMTGRPGITTINVEATDEVPAPFYVGTLETEDGDIDCSHKAA